MSHTQNWKKKHHNRRRRRHSNESPMMDESHFDILQYLFCFISSHRLIVQWSTFDRTNEKRNKSKRFDHQININKIEEIYTIFCVCLIKIWHIHITVIHCCFVSIISSSSFFFFCCYFGGSNPRDHRQNKTFLVRTTASTSTVNYII